MRLREHALYSALMSASATLLVRVSQGDAEATRALAHDLATRAGAPPSSTDGDGRELREFVLVRWPQDADERIGFKQIVPDAAEGFRRSGHEVIRVRELPAGETRQLAERCAEAFEGGALTGAEIRAIGDFCWGRIDRPALVAVLSAGETREQPCTKEDPCDRPCFGTISGCPYSPHSRPATDGAQVGMGQSYDEIPYVIASVTAEAPLLNPEHVVSQVLAAFRNVSEATPTVIAIVVPVRVAGTVRERVELILSMGEFTSEGSHG